MIVCSIVIYPLQFHNKSARRVTATQDVVDDTDRLIFNIMLQENMIEDFTTSEEIANT